MSELVQYILTVVSMGLLGAFLAVLLFFVSKFFAVKKDQKIVDVEEILPGINCGACGFPGCSGYANAIVNSGAPIDKCSPGAGAVISALASYLGIEAGEDSLPMKAFVACRGSRDKAAIKYDYRGMKDCNAMKLLYQGDKVCSYGCLAGGSCIKVCPVDAISYDSEGCVVVDQKKCIGCEKCIAVCPTNVIKMIPENSKFAVACNSKDKGGVVKKYCTVGCIGCKICEKVSTDGGFIIEDFLARIDYSKISNQNIAYQKCPAKCILELNK
ncbi:MAG: RnfABCDGE type electron transport complex subunit B [Spirochaetales bacterium]|nr:RnfABCDGE type electron transport complex subunit B [Spirochaetales bacterium]